MDSSAAGYNQSSFQGMSNMGAQFEAQRMRSSAMLEYEEPDMKRKDMDDDVNEGLGTSGGLSKFGKGAKDFYSKYQEIKGEKVPFSDKSVLLEKVAQLSSSGER